MDQSINPVSLPIVRYVRYILGYIFGELERRKILSRLVWRREEGGVALGGGGLEGGRQNIIPSLALHRNTMLLSHEPRRKKHFGRQPLGGGGAWRRNIKNDVYRVCRWILFN